MDFSILRNIASAGVAVAFAQFAMAGPSAAAVRTYLSSGGTNTGACPIAAPCRTLSFALSKTDAGGVVVILDSTSAGSATINKAVTIESAPGQAGMVQVPASGTGITVAAAPGDLVVLRNIQFNAAPLTGAIGISHTGGKLVVEDSEFANLQVAISVSNAKMDVIDSTLAGNEVAIRATGAGTEISGSTTTSSAQVRVSGGDVLANGVGFRMINPGTGFANIFVRLTENGSFSWATNTGGNTTLIEGSGTGCPCSTIGTYLPAFPPK